MNERDGAPSASPRGQPGPQPAFYPAADDRAVGPHPAASAPRPDEGDGRAADAGHGEPAPALTGELPGEPDQSDSEGHGADRTTVLAEWALWGKRTDDPEYSVLRCSTGSAGTFGRGDFHDIITRYASGRQESLPQYTVCWVPGENGHEGYLAVAIHELADPDPRRAGGRVRAARGREIEYTRLFCVTYTEMAKHQVSYTELVESVQDYQLPVGSTVPVTVELVETEPPNFSASDNALAENVATLLLTTRPVCVLGADDVSAKDRLRFIEQVMSLLPYGLRTRMSASTWASATASNLNLRLFFTSAERGDGGTTVTWGQPKRYDFSAPERTTLRHYVNWLERGGAAAAPELAGLTDPVRFDPDELRQMVVTLPRDRPVKDTLEQLADGLRRGELPVVRVAVKRIRQRQNRPRSLEERKKYRREIKRLGLFKDYPRLRPNTMASVYRVLLELAFGANLSYADYREIVDLAGGPPHRRLAKEMLQATFGTFLPWLLTYRAASELTDQELVVSLHGQGMGAAQPVTDFCQHTGRVHPDDRPVGYDFAVRYLRAYAEDPKAELVKRGYLTETLERVFPHDRNAQRARIREFLALVYEGPLSEEQKVGLLIHPGIRHTAAFDEAVKEPASVHRHRKPRRVQRLREQPGAALKGAARAKVTVNAGLVVIGIALIVMLVAIILLAYLLQDFHV